MRHPLIFVTDFGRDDTYAAALIGAAWAVDPQARCVDGTHGVPPGNVLAGAYHLKALALAFEPPVVFCAVVDPGVGTARRAIAIETDGVVCVAPDNGLISYLWEETPAGLRRAVELEIPEQASTTFHGRDVFAPVAAQLASGSSLDDAGVPIDDPIVLSEAFAQRSAGRLSGRVAVVDHFGNAITIIRDVDLAGSPVLRAGWSGGETSVSVATYDQIGDGLAVLIGSAGHLEIAARGVASATLGGPSLGDAVTVDLP
jgi:S-adenosylmethionine hydrolase